MLLLCLICGVADADDATLILHWNFDAPQGTTVLDASAQDRHGILERGHGHHPVPSRHPEIGILGGSAKVESRSRIVAKKIHPIGSTFTLSFWVKQDDPEANGNVFCQVDTIRCQVFDGIFRVHEKSLGNLDSKRVTPGDWEHYVIRVEPGRLQVFVNGQLGAEKKKDGWSFKAEGGKLFFGAPDWHRQYLGHIDEVRLYKGALSPNAINALSLDVYHPTASWVGKLTPTEKKIVTEGKLSKPVLDTMKGSTALDLKSLRKSSKKNVRSAWGLAGRLTLKSLTDR
jgi:hypothetical protein